jgi:hypothetical protein
VASILGALGWDALAAGPADTSAAFKVLLGDLHECGVTYYSTGSGAVPVIVQDLCDRGHTFSFECPSCGGALPRFTRSSLTVHPELSAYSQHADVFFADRLSDDVLELASAAHAQNAFIVYEPSDGKDDWHLMPAVKAARVVDTCGAGDWLTSGILFGLREYADGIELGARRCAEQIIRSAQQLAAWSCGFAGARGALYEEGPAVARSILGASSIEPARLAPLPEPTTTTACLSCPT